VCFPPIADIREEDGLARKRVAKLIGRAPEEWSTGALMSLDERVSELIKRIYCAGEDRDEWDFVGTEVLQMVGAHAGLATVTDLTNRELGDCRFYGKETTSFAKGIEEYAVQYKDDPSLRWGAAHTHARFCNSADTLPAGDYLENPYVKWNLARFGSTHWVVGYTQPEQDLSFSFSVHFPAEQGPGEAESLRLFRMLFDHMECSVRLRRRPFNPVSARALVLMDATGRVQQVSTGAERLLDQTGALKIVDGRLQTAIGAEQRKLDLVLRDTARTIEAGVRSSAVRIAHPFGKREWIVTVRPLLRKLGPFGRPRCELLVEIHDAIPRIGSIQIMQSLFDLTDREMQLVRQLADGHSIESLAHEMKISRNTARTHLRAIFFKTSTTRQSELLQLCAGLSTP
jgi:DNA-binding CsgD family transcriptional regulator